MNNNFNSNNDYKVKSYHIENIGCGNMALFGQLKNGLYFSEYDFQMYLYDIDPYPIQENDKATEKDWNNLEKHSKYFAEYRDKAYYEIIKQTGYDYFNKTQLELLKKNTIKNENTLKEF